MQENLVKDNGHSLVLVPKRSGLVRKKSPQGIWDTLAEKMLLEFAESTCPIFRATTPFSRGQLGSKGRGKLSIHFAADLETVETFALLSLQTSSVFTEQSRRYLKSMNPFTRERRDLLLQQYGEWPVVNTLPRDDET